MVAEEVKIQAGRNFDSKADSTIKVRGRDLMTGLPKEVNVTVEQIQHALQRSVNSIIDGVKSTLEITPPELVADIFQRGLILAGGGAMLAGLDQVISKVTKIPVKIIEDPLTCAVRGMGLVLEDEILLKEVAVPSTTSEANVSR